MSITPELRQQLIDQGWTPPPDLDALVDAERGIGRPLGCGHGDTRPVYLHVRERTDMVIAIEQHCYDLSAEEGELAELLDDRPDDYRRTTYTVLDA